MATVKKDGKYGYINTKGNFVVNDENGNRIEISGKFDNAYSFTEDLAVVKKDGKYGYINTKGEQVIECKFDYAYSFKEGLATVKNNYSYSYFTINTKGNFVVNDENGNRIEISGKFDEAYSFTEDLAVVKKDGKYGYINTKGEWVIECKFGYAHDFKKGLTEVMKDGQWVVINTKGNFIVFDEDNNQIEVIKEVSDKSGNVFLLSKSDDKFGLLDANYNVLIKNKLYGEFEVVQRMNENTFLIKMAEKEFFIDSNGDFK
nr:WG repeat-containing protein [Campylobacter rectus]